MHDRVLRAGLIGCAVVFGIGFVGGCEDPTRDADRKVQAVIDQVRPKDTFTQAQKLYDQAVTLGAGVASPIEQAIALEASARNQMQTAVDSIAQIDHSRFDAGQTTSAISDLISNIRGEQTIVDAWMATDPKDVKAYLDADEKRATGGPTAVVWYPHDQSPIPTLSKAQADIDRLAAAIDGNNQEQQRLQKTHDDLVAQADQLERKSEGETGQVSVDDYKKASDLRKQAADLSANGEKLQAALIPLAQNLAIAQAQMQIVQQAIANMRKDSTGLDAAWTDLQSKLADAQQRIATYNKASDATPSVTSMAADLMNQIGDIDARRKVAIDHLDKAIASLGKAYGQAVQQRTVLQQTLASGTPTPAQQAMQLRIENNSPEQMLIEETDAMRLEADLHAAWAGDLAVRQQLIETAAPIYKRANLTLPQGLDASLATQRDGETKAAADLYAKADALLDRLGAASTPRDLKTAGIARKVFLQVDWAILDPQGDHLSKARDAVNRLPDPKAVALPVVVAPAPALPPEPTGTLPATSPATTTPDATTAPAPAP